MSKLPTEPDMGLPLVWVDRMQLTAREDLPIVTLRFYSALHDRVIECSRLQTSAAHLRAMADLICQKLDYYPTKPDA